MALRSAAAAALLFAVACKDAGSPPQATAPVKQPGTGAGTAGAADAGSAVNLPPPPPIPPPPAFLDTPQAPSDNPTTPEKVHLGHLLFFDKRMSKDASMSCSECHHIDKAYTDGRAVSPKVGGALNKRNSPTVVNLGQHRLFYWDGRKPTLESVSEAAWTGQLSAEPKAIAERLNANATYKALFQRAFKSDATAQNVPMALAAFFRALHSGDSAWDRYEKGDRAAVSAEAVHGFEVFRNVGCAQCHVPPLYSDSDFHNVGIGHDKTAGGADQGRLDATKKGDDAGKFKTPSLRDITRTGPYFHDGSVASLDEAIDLMLAGGVKGAKNVDPKLKPQKISAKDRKALEAFLESLDGRLSIAHAPQLPQ